MEITPSFLQSKAWERVQQRLQKKTYWLDETLFIRQPLRFGQSYWYAPRAQLIPNEENVDRIFKRETTFVRLEPQVDTTLEKPWLVAKSVQPRQTLLLDLTQSEDDLLAAMKPKTRYNISLAKRKKVNVVAYNYPDSLKYLPYFLRLTHETNLRNQLSSYDENYYRSLLEELGREEMATLFVAYANDTPLSSLILIRYKGTATYLFGASASQQREVMAPYLLQWEAIRYARDNEDNIYDFWGVRVDSKFAHHQQPNDVSPDDYQPMPGRTFGVTRFKLGFNGLIHFYPPAYDRSYKPFWYNLYKGYHTLTGSKGFNY